MITATNTQSQALPSTEKRLDAIEATLHQIETVLVLKYPSKWVDEETALDILKISKHELEHHVQKGRVRYSTVNPQVKYWKPDLHQMVLSYCKGIATKTMSHGN